MPEMTSWRMVFTRELHHRKIGWGLVNRLDQPYPGAIDVRFDPEDTENRPTGFYLETPYGALVDTTVAGMRAYEPFSHGTLGNRMNAPWARLVDLGLARDFDAAEIDAALDGLDEAAQRVLIDARRGEPAGIGTRLPAPERGMIVDLTRRGLITGRISCIAAYDLNAFGATVADRLIAASITPAAEVA